MWTKLHYFARVFNPTKSFVVDTIIIVLSEMKWFLLFLGLTLLGFALAFYCLFRFDRDAAPVGGARGARGARAGVCGCCAAGRLCCRARDLRPRCECCRAGVLGS
jgi:hypothetical protein